MATLSFPHLQLYIHLMWPLLHTHTGLTWLEKKNHTFYPIAYARRSQSHTNRLFVQIGCSWVSSISWSRAAGYIPGTVLCKLFLGSDMGTTNQQAPWINFINESGYIDHAKSFTTITNHKSKYPFKSRKKLKKQREMETRGESETSSQFACAVLAITMAIISIHPCSCMFVCTVYCPTHNIQTNWPIKFAYRSLSGPEN